MLGFAGTARADGSDDVDDPPLLYISSPAPACAVPQNCRVTDKSAGVTLNALGRNSMTLTYFNNGKGLPGLQGKVLLILGFPNVSSTFVPPSITLTGGTGQAGGPNVYPTNTTKWDSNGYAGFYTSAFTAPYGSPNTVYTYVGLVTPGGGAETLSAWTSAELHVGGISANGFGIVVYELSGTALTPGSAVTINFSSPLPFGTYAIAYGCSSALAARAGACPGNNTFTTPFTQAGIVVPEPATLLLLGSGLIAAGALRKKQQKKLDP